MIFRAYLRTFDGRVSEKTVTHALDAAITAFAALVNRTDLDGQKFAVALTGDNRQIAFHRFDRRPGDADYWRDRIEEIEIPGLGSGWGGARPGAGRPSLGPRVRVELRLSPEQAEKLERLGGPDWIKREIDAAD